MNKQIKPNKRKPIVNFLSKYTAENFVRCHMPGHKGELGTSDITEIKGAGSLYENAPSIITESERRTSLRFGSHSTYYSTSGSTLAIQTMLLTAQQIGVKSLQAGRYSHKSLINTAIMLDMDIEWIYPNKFLSCQVVPKHNGATFYTSIDYLGGECPTAWYKNCSLKLCDNAHGAHRLYTGNHPITLGADMVADSAHKTLSVLTGGAYLHLGKKFGKRFVDNSQVDIKANMAMFATSSPSYLILESLEKAFPNKKNNPATYIDSIKSGLQQRGFSLKKSDATKIVFKAYSVGYTGFELQDEMIKAGIMPEYADDNYVVLMFSYVKYNSYMDLVLRLLKLKPKASIPKTQHMILHPEIACSPRTAYFGQKVQLPIESATERIMAEVIAPCPPCVPLVMPGERLGVAEIEELKKFNVKSVKVLK